jgi:hypothetical protein
MNQQLILDAIDNIRKIAQTKARYRPLIPKDMVDIEICLQQILLEVGTVKEVGLWEKIKNFILKFHWFWAVG